MVGSWSKFPTLTQRHTKRGTQRQRERERLCKKRREKREREIPGNGGGKEGMNEEGRKEGAREIWYFSRKKCFFSGEVSYLVDFLLSGVKRISPSNQAKVHAMAEWWQGLIFRGEERGGYPATVWYFNR